MLIGGVSSMASSTVVFNPVIASSAPSSSPSAATVAPAATQVPSSASATDAQPTSTSGPRTASGGGEDMHGASASAASSSAAAEVEVTTYSMSVAGNQYWGSVEQSGGDFTASVPNLAGASATGLSEQEAESNLAARVDELV
jgi:hypothetical protein